MTTLVKQSFTVSNVIVDSEIIIILVVICLHMRNIMKMVKRKEQSLVQERSIKIRFVLTAQRKLLMEIYLNT